jgi:hypothetical protein
MIGFNHPSWLLAITAANLIITALTQPPEKLSGPAYFLSVVFHLFSETPKQPLTSKLSTPWSESYGKRINQYFSTTPLPKLDNPFGTGNLKFGQPLPQIVSPENIFLILCSYFVWRVRPSRVAQNNLGPAGLLNLIFSLVSLWIYLIGADSEVFTQCPVLHLGKRIVLAHLTQIQYLWCVVGLRLTLSKLWNKYLIRFALLILLIGAVYQYGQPRFTY